MYPENGIILVEAGTIDIQLALELCSTYLAAAQALKPDFMPETFNVRIGLHQLDDVQQGYVVNQNLAPVFAPFTSSASDLPVTDLSWTTDLPDAVRELLNLQALLLDPATVCDGLDLPAIHAKLADGLTRISYYGVVVHIERSGISIAATHIRARFRTTCPLNERGNQEGWCNIQGKDYQLNFSLYEVSRLLHLLQQEVVWRFTNACHQQLQQHPGHPGPVMIEALQRLPLVRIDTIPATLVQIEPVDIIQFDDQQAYMVVSKRIGSKTRQADRIEYAAGGTTGNLSPVPELSAIYRMIFPG